MWLRVLTVVLLTLACAVSNAQAALSPLHAVRGGAHPGVFDAGGREVLLRGVNVNGLGDYYKASDLDPVVPLTRRDFTDIAALGMNSVRLLIHWSALEPQRGRFDDAYLARVREAVGWAEDAGLYVVLDMHQDAWGKSIATPAGETCLPGFSAALGWDGAPEWATLTDGLPTCKLAQRELAPATAQAWQSFWLDREGIQTELVRTWAHVAKAFAEEPAVAGYDLLNEPNPGFLVGATETTSLATYYTNALAAIRGAGGRGIGFLEPSVVWSLLADDVVFPAGSISDTNVVFAPHLYGGSIALQDVEPGFERAAQAGRGLGTTVWSGEWGWFGDPARDRSAIGRYALQEDAHRYGGAWWDWKQACGDPHNFSAPGTKPYGVSPSLVRFACNPQRELGIPATTRRILTRPYARAAPGELRTTYAEPNEHAFNVSGRRRDGSGNCTIDVWFPGAARPVFATQGVDRARAEAVPGGWRITGCARAGDGWSVRGDGTTTPVGAHRRARTPRCRAATLWTWTRTRCSASRRTPRPMR